VRGVSRLKKCDGLVDAIRHEDEKSDKLGDYRKQHENQCLQVSTPLVGLLSFTAHYRLESTFRTA
jgi:hypothetical protein